MDMTLSQLLFGSPKFLSWTGKDQPTLCRKDVHFFVCVRALLVNLQLVLGLSLLWHPFCFLCVELQVLLCLWHLFELVHSMRLKLPVMLSVVQLSLTGGWPLVPGHLVAQSALGAATTWTLARIHTGKKTPSLLVASLEVLQVACLCSAVSFVSVHSPLQGALHATFPVLFWRTSLQHRPPPPPPPPFASSSFASPSFASPSFASAAVGLVPCRSRVTLEPPPAFRRISVDAVPSRCARAPWTARL